jgi:hypothetical protein
MLDDLQRDLTDILDNRVLIYPQTLKALGIGKEATLQERKEKLGVKQKQYNYSEKQQRFLDFVKTKAENARKANWQWRIQQEAEEKQTLGWYPFFVTLTVDPKKCDGFERKLKSGRILRGYESPEQLWKEGREFRRYIRDLANVVAKELGHQPPHKTNTPESEYITYAGVIEHGKSREHHHGHFLIWLREIPNRWKVCPNERIANPANRNKNECKELSIKWPWSSYDPVTGVYLSPAMYYRTLGDKWSDLGFCLPLKDGQPMRVASAAAAGRYVTKYMQKEHKEWHHRMKCTRNLGMRKLQELIQSLDQRTVQLLTYRPATSRQLHSVSLTHSVPIGLIRSLAKRMHYWDRLVQNQLDLKEHLKPNYKSYQKMLTSVRSGVRPDRMHSLEFYDWVSQFLPDQEGYCEKSVLEAHRLIGIIFPRITSRINPIKLGANNSGFTCSV